MDRLIERYGEGYRLVADAIQGLSDQEANFKPSADQWSIREIVVHLADAEVVAIHRMKKILAERNPLLTAFDQDLWAKANFYSNMDYRLYLELFRILRESMIPVLNQVSEEDWQRTGIHNEAGKLTLKDVLQSYVSHVDDHLRQIARVKTALRRIN